MIKHILLGIVVGMLFLYIFVYFGGADYLKIFGKKTIRAGQELKQYEKPVKDVKGVLEEKLEKAKDKVKEKME